MDSIIQYELNQLGFPGVAKEQLLEESIIPSLVEGITDEMEREFKTIYLFDIQRRLRVLEAPKRKKFTVRKRNMPAGVEFVNNQFVSSILVGDLEVPVPPHVDLDSHLQMRHLMGRRRDELVGHQDAVESVKKLSTQLAASFVIQDQLAELETPKKIKTATSHESKATPMTAPHTTMSGSDIVKLRDKFFARIPLFSEFIEAPKRDTRSDSQLDANEIRSKIDSYRVEVDNPSLQENRRRAIIAQVKLFADSLVTCPPKHALTPQPDRSLPQEVRTRDDGQFYSIMIVFEESIQMPVRGTVKEVLDDRLKFDVELKRIRSLISTSKSPNLTAHKATVISSMTRFAKSLTKVSASSSDTPIHRVREKFYSSLEVMGQSVSTPVRATESEVVADKEIAQEVITAMHAAGKEVVLAEIRSRWTNVDKTPRKL